VFSSLSDLRTESLSKEIVDLAVQSVGLFVGQVAATKRHERNRSVSSGAESNGSKVDKAAGAYRSMDW
jgi:hypothetical protein